jgi:hypothetical protein
MPCFWLVICHAAANQTVSGVRVRWKIVPAVGEVCRPQLAHSRRPLLSSQPTRPPHTGQDQPPGQRSQSS